MRNTHTYSVLEISKKAWEEIAGLLRTAGYEQAFSLDGKTIDMHGIGLEVDPRPEMISIKIFGSVSPDDLRIAEQSLLAQIAGRKVLPPPPLDNVVVDSSYWPFSFGQARVMRGSGVHPHTQAQGSITRIDILVEK